MSQCGFFDNHTKAILDKDRVMNWVLVAPMYIIPKGLDNKSKIPKRYILLDKVYNVKYINDQVYLDWEKDSISLSWSDFLMEDPWHIGFNILMFDSIGTPVGYYQHLGIVFDPASEPIIMQPEGGWFPNKPFIQSAKTIPPNTVRLPSELTAENGAKGLLNGEFFIEVEQLSEYGYDKYEIVKEPIPWTTIKDIYKMIVKNMQIPEEGKTPE